jgi:hypothetical protein
MSNLYKNTKMALKLDQKRRQTGIFFQFEMYQIQQIVSFVLFLQRSHVFAWLYGIPQNEIREFNAKPIITALYFYVCCYQCMLLIYMINECSEHFCVGYNAGKEASHCCGNTWAAGGSPGEHQGFQPQVT